MISLPVWLPRALLRLQSLVYRCPLTVSAFSIHLPNTAVKSWPPLVKQNSLNNYEKEREALKNSIQHIDTTQDSMNNLAREDLKAFGSSLNILQTTWRSALADVQKIQGWLKTGQGLQVSLNFTNPKKRWQDGADNSANLGIFSNKVHS